jgi:hypothetical protein
MFVRQLIGREAGTIINLPFTAAQSCLAMGTVEAVTDEEIAAAGLELDPVVVNRPDELPHGFRVETIPGGGFDLYDPGGVNISKEVDLPNLIAARDLAWSVLHPAEPAPDTTALEELTKADLLKIAEAANIELAGNAKKADIITALVAAGITTPPDAGGGIPNDEQPVAGNESNSTGETTSEGAADGAAGNGSADSGSEGQAE